MSPTQLGVQAQSLGSNSACGLASQVGLASWLDSCDTLTMTI